MIDNKDSAPLKSKRNGDVMQKNLQETIQKNEISSTDKPSKKCTVKQTPQDSSLIPTLGVFIFLGWNGILVCVLFYGTLFATNVQRSIMIGLCTLSVVLPRSFPGRLGFLLGEWLAAQSAKYFGLTTVLEDENAIAQIEDKAAIFTCEPHDVLPYYTFCFNPSLKLLPGHHGVVNCCLVTSMLFKLPFIRHVYTWICAHPVDKKTFLGRLRNCESFSFIPGGVQEVILMDEAQDDEVVLFLKNRKGFVKLALETGSPIVPVYCFGVKGSFGHWIPRGEMISKFGRRVGFLPLLYWGRFGIPFGIPKPHQLTVVFGKPIDVPSEGENVNKESVEKYHSLYLKELESLFERNKEEHGYGQMKLKIM
eukprot:CAMPEP_0185723852 /NCGR_PEP_ID=MMETSP1171-20130828/548_1 /TAXON_ID=374046 /ORGANISM="Helicotheca tamensis, Strain CCMP826" /LENGTH=363 /DNA_ID=CAMNT_0028391607 /DNA_START=45 /DNA_END=1136 /DNA_ORIENTATION=+